MSVNLRSHERNQLLEMLPTAKEMYERQNYEDGTETIAKAIEEIEEGDPELEDQEWQTVVMALSSHYVSDEHGGSRASWLSKKLVHRALHDTTVSMRWPGL